MLQVETWYKIWCDECGAINWVCDGDTGDMTVCDVEGFLCHKCKAVHALSEEEPGDPECYEIGIIKPM